LIHTRLSSAILALAASAILAGNAAAQPALIAKGTLTASKAGAYRDLSGLTDTLENGVPASLLGGFGSGITYAGGNTFLAVPDRGPNAVPFNPLVDDTDSYIARFQTIHMNLVRTPHGALPFSIDPALRSTTLLWSTTPLVYGTGAGLNIGSGVPAENTSLHHFFTGRSDNFDPSEGSFDFNDARIDPEAIRIAKDGQSVFISDEYGPYVYQFSRATGQRLRSFTLPAEFYVATPKPVGNDEIAANSSGRVADKGMEGLAITPDGTTLVGLVQAPLIQDAAFGGAAKKLLRMVSIDIASGTTTHEYAYLLTTGSGVSEIVALNNHEFIVDERDGNGLAGGGAAHAVSKSLFVDLVQVLTATGIPATQIPAKIEGLTFGPDVNMSGKKMHTLWVANDNDFLQDFAGPGTNPNQFFVVGFTDADLNGSVLMHEQEGESFE
jgi:hypothetical protein